MQLRAQAPADDLAEARRRFACWRKSRGNCGRIPHDLWVAAVNAAAAHGAQTVAVELRLDLTRLKQWMRALNGDQRECASPTFVEVAPPSKSAEIAVGGPTPECMLELEEPSGRRLRILLKGPATTQALELGRALWRAWP